MGQTDRQMTDMITETESSHTYNVQAYKLTIAHSTLNSGAKTAEPALPYSNALIS